MLEVKIEAPRQGYTAYDTRPVKGKPSCPITLAVVALAGHEAEHRCYGRPIDLLPASDYESVVALGVTTEAANLIGDTTRRLIRRWEPEIRRVQRALLLRGRLGPRQFLAALKEAS